MADQESRGRESIRRDVERMREQGFKKSDAERIGRAAQEKLSRALDQRKE